MAKKKKLNTRLVVLLSVVGVLVLAAGFAAVASKVIKRDPTPFLKAGQDFEDKGELAEAEKQYGLAMAAAKDDVDMQVDILHRQARTQLAYRDLPNKTKTEIDEKRDTAVRMLNAAIQLKSDYLPAHELLCKILWEYGYMDYIEEATKMLELKRPAESMKNDHLVYFRRAERNRILAIQRGGTYVDQAAGDYRMAIKLKGDEPDYWISLAMLADQFKTVGDSSAVYEEALKANPSASEIYIAYATWCSRHDRAAQAKQLIADAVKNAAKGDVKPHLYMAGVHMRDAKYPQAYEQLQAAKAIDGANSDVYIMLGELFTMQNKLDDAINNVREGLDEVTRLLGDPKARGSRDQQELEGAKLTLLYQLCSMSLDRQLKESVPAKRKAYLGECQALVDQYVKASPESPQKTRLKGKLLFQQAIDRRPGATITGAIVILEQAKNDLRVDEGVQLTRAGLAEYNRVVKDLYVAYLAANRTVDAGKMLDTLLTMPGYSRNPTLLISKASIEKANGNYAKAMGLLSMVLKNDPNNVRAKEMMTALQILTSSGNEDIPGGEVTPNVIRAVMAKAARLAPSDPEGALRMVEELHAQAPNNTALGLALVKLYGQPHRDKAIALLKKMAQEATNPKLKEQLQELVSQVSEVNVDKLFARLMSDIDKQKFADDPKQDKFRKAIAKMDLTASFRKDDLYLRYLDEAAQIDGRNPQVVSKKFELALAAKNWPEAEKWVKIAADDDIDGCKGLRFQAQMEDARGNSAKAIKAMEDAVALQPDQRSVELALAQYCATHGQPAKAEKHFKHLLDNDAGMFQALLGMARLTQRDPKRQKDFRDYITRAYALQPNQPYVKSMYLLLTEETYTTAAQISELIKQREELFNRSKQDLQNVYRLAVLYEKVHRNDDAEKKYIFGLQYSQNRTAAAAELVGFYLRQGQMAKIDQLIAKLKAEPNADLVGISVLYANVLSGRDPDQAIIAYKQAIAANDKDPRGHRALAAFHASRDQWKQAVAAMEQYLKLNPKAVERGEDKQLIGYLIGGGEYDRAKGMIDRILKSSPKDDDCLAMDAEIYLRKKDIPSARKAMDLAVSANPKHYAPLVRRAAFFKGQHEDDKCIDDLKAARGLTPHPDLAMELAQAYLRQQDTGQAKQVLTDVISKHNDYKPAQDMLMDLYIQEGNRSALSALIKEVTGVDREGVEALKKWDRYYRMIGNRDRRCEQLMKLYEKAGDDPAAVEIVLNGFVEEEHWKDALFVASQPNIKGKSGYEFADVFVARAKVGSGAADGDAAFTALIKNSDEKQLSYVLAQAMQAYRDDDGKQRKDLLNKAVAWSKVRPGFQTQYFAAEVAVNARNYPVATDAMAKALELAKTAGQKALVNAKLALVHYESFQRNPDDKASLKKAQSNFEDTLKNNPTDVVSMNNLAYLYTVDLDAPEKALPHAELAARLQPSASVLDTYGWTLVRCGDHVSDADKKKSYYEQGRQVLERARSKGRQTAILYHLGYVMEKQDKKDDALNLYRQGWELVQSDPKDPLYQLIKQGRERLTK